MKRSKKGGFTLIEVLVVVAVILLLSGMLFRVSNVVIERSNRAAAIGDMNAIANALEEYFAVFGHYPPVGRAGYQYAHGVPEGGEAGAADSYRDGLIAYLHGRKAGDPLPCFVGDVKHRWLHYLDGVNHFTFEQEPGQTFVDATPFEYMVFLDLYRTPWPGNYNYSSSPPYMSYTLYARLPSGERVELSSSGL